VTTAAVYLTWLLALLSRGPAGGALVGLTFGAGRALVVLTMADVDDAERLRAAHRRLARLAPTARLACTAVVGLTGVALAVAAGVAAAGGA
jgi:sulfite exporter TauE/SafE